MRKEKIMEVLSRLDAEEIIRISNEYCEKNGYYDDIIYSMNEFDEQMENFSPWDIASKIWNGDFNPNHDYWKFDGYANLQSFYGASDVVESEIWYCDIAEYCDENDECFGNDEIEDIIVKYWNYYERRLVERDYGLEDGELDGLDLKEAEDLLGLEEGDLDRYLINNIDEWEE